MGGMSATNGYYVHVLHEEYQWLLMRYFEERITYYIMKHYNIWFLLLCQIKPSWMIKKMSLKTSVLNGIMCLILMYPGQVLGGTWPSLRLLFIWGYPKKILLKISGQNILFWMSYKDSYWNVQFSGIWAHCVLCPI